MYVEKDIWIEGERLAAPRLVSYGHIAPLPRALTALNVQRFYAVLLLCRHGGVQFGIWPGSRLVGTSGKELTCSGCAVYGPRTTLYLAFACEPQVVELTLSVEGKWRVTRSVAGIRSGKLYAPANMRSAQDNAGYQRLLDLWAKERYTLRYTGGMVPDICQLLVKGKGVFASPVSPSAPAKLRLLYEALPMAFLVEKAGGASTDGSLDSMLQCVVFGCDDRTPICVGSAEDVRRFREHCPRVFDKSLKLG